MKLKSHTKNIKHLDFVISGVQSSKDAGGDCLIEGYANTSTKDRVGDVVMPEAFSKSLPTYLKNPVLLCNHDWNDPCGRVQHAEITDKGLFVRARISDTRADIKTLIREKVLSTFSIGYNELDADYDESTKTKYVKELELLEISVVTVPANTEASFTEASTKVETEEADEKETSGKKSARTARQLSDFIVMVKSACDRNLDSNEIIAICDYFNKNEEVMTKAELIALLRTKSVAQEAPAAEAPTDAAKAEAPADAAPAMDAGAMMDMLKQLAAKLDAVAQGLAQVLEGQAKPAEAPAKEEAEKPADEAKNEDATADAEKQDGECMDGEKDKDEDEEEAKELDPAAVDAELAAINAAIAEIEDAEEAI